MLLERYDGQVPADPEQLRLLPGIGPYTAGAIAAFAFNQPAVFLETNIRAVLLHLFCGEQQGVADRELLHIVERTLDRQQPGRWYNALMDYGSGLKRRLPNPSRRSRHHTVQSRFEGSDRQVRGAVLRLLLEGAGMPDGALCEQLAVESGRLQRILAELEQEGFITRTGGMCRIC
jgi:A/G-specific adenine glycosylase